VVRVLVGRTEEVSVVGQFLAGPVAGPRALLIEGEPGIGKTTLLRELLAIAGERNHAVLLCRPSRSEMDLSYAGLVELLSGLDDADIEGLPGPQARVLRMVLREEEPDGTFDRLSLRVAVVAAIRAVAAARPVLVAVDDAQWLDQPTARTLMFAARRLADSGVRFAVVRSDQVWRSLPSPGPPHSPGSSPGSSYSPGSSISTVSRGPERPPRGEEAVDWRAELARALPDGALSAIRLGPVGASELSRIVRGELGWVPAWPRVARIAELSAGNPLFALEIARAARPSDSGAGADIDGMLPDSVLGLAMSRIAALAPDVRYAVELASVPRAAALDLLARLAPAADVRTALEAAAMADIVRVDGDLVRFAHPILAAAAYGAITADRKRELHRAAAALSADPEERARHLAIAADGPDAQVADALEEAAEGAWRRGAPDTAADLLRMAARLTPDDERAGTAAGSAFWRRRIGYGRLLHSSGDSTGSVTELESVVASLPPGPLRARARYHLMYVARLSGSPVRAMEHGVRAAAEAAADPSFQAEVYEMLSRLSDDDIGRKLDAARKGISAVERAIDPDPSVLFHARAALVEAEFYAGLGIHLERLDGIDLSRASVRFPPVRTAARGEDLIGRLLGYDGQVDKGLAALGGLRDKASVENRSILHAVLGWMAEVQLIAGRFAAAAELTADAIGCAEETGGAATPWEVGYHAMALALLGRIAEAEALAQGVLARAAADPAIGMDEWPARLALGIAGVATARFAAALPHLRHLDAAKREAGIGEPRLLAHSWDLIEALVGTGQLAEAATTLDRLDAQAASSGGLWAAAAAARCRALLLAAAGHLDDAVAAAERSLSLLDGTSLPFERGRTLLVLGQLHRRRKEKRLAMAALDEALATFTELRAAAWAARTEAELARIPGRRSVAASGHPAADSLTATEEMIARLAAGGLSNREIADRLFLSTKTVEVNLTRVYRKLGVRSRSALAARYAGGPEHREP
jgi:DNA-binding CsgD family transcriptional regulator